MFNVSLENPAILTLRYGRDSKSSLYNFVQEFMQDPDHRMRYVRNELFWGGSSYTTTSASPNFLDEMWDHYKTWDFLREDAHNTDNHDLLVRLTISIHPRLECYDGDIAEKALDTLDNSLLKSSNVCIGDEKMHANIDIKQPLLYPFDRVTCKDVWNLLKDTAYIIKDTASIASRCIGY